MCKFNTYEEPKFLHILETIYKIERVHPFNGTQHNTIGPFFRSTVRGGDIFNMPFNFYHSIDIAAEEKQSYFEELRAYSRDNKVNIRLKGLTEYQDLEKKYYANNPIINLGAGKDFSKNLIQNIKRNTNKSDRHDIQIAETNKIDDLVEFYNNVLSVTYIDKHKMVFQPLSLYTSLLESNLAKFFIAKRSNTILGGIICIHDNDTLHYNWGASLNFENIAIGTLLINHAVEFAKKHRYKFFDLGSTSLSDNDLYSFKMKWGADNYPVYEHYTLTRPGDIDLNSSYQLAREIYSRFPKPFLRWLMPKIVPLLVQ